MSNFMPVDRQTNYLFPLSVADWLPESRLDGIPEGIQSETEGTSPTWECGAGHWADGLLVRVDIPDCMAVLTFPQSVACAAPLGPDDSRIGHADGFGGCDFLFNWS
jgi:hypothetical protein